MFATKNSVHSDLAAALRECRRAFASVALFSGVVNLLMLAGPLYMLQIYDRVLSSRSVPTLVALSVFLVGAYAFQGALDLIRSRVVVRAATLLDQHLALAVHGAVIRLAIAIRHPGEGPQPVRDLDQIRTSLTGAGPIAIVDLPWVPVFLSICFLIHPWLGLVAYRGAIVLVRDDAADRARKPRPRAPCGAGRGDAFGHGGRAAARRRDHHGDGDDGIVGAALVLRALRHDWRQFVARRACRCCADRPLRAHSTRA